MARQTDKIAMDRIQKMLSGTLWDRAADLLDAIAEVVRSTGRPMVDVDGNNPVHWKDV